MKSIISSVFKKFPEGNLKNRIRCFFYNRLQNEFRIHFKNNLFIVEKNGIVMRFNENPYQQFLNDKDYFHQFELKAGDVLVDGGAFRGMLSIYASKLVGEKGHIIALEPDPEQYDRLVKNIDLNAVKNITVIKKGLWSENTVLSFRSGNELASSFINANDKGSVLNVPVTTIDDIFSGITVPGKVLIKMNIEGSEIEAVKGAEHTVEKYRPAFVIRTNHLVEGRFTDDRVEEILRRFGYKPETKVLHEQTTFA